MVRHVWLLVGALSILGCATAPVPSEPLAAYALLRFPASMRLLSLDDRSFDTSRRIDTLQVRPGAHTLRLMHVNDGVDGSADHAGQIAYPFTLEVQEGLVYHFESKT